jgi:hypothetical protein
MMQRLVRRWQGTFPPWVLAGAFAALAVIMVIGFPPGATASQSGGQTYIGQTFERSVPPDILVGAIQPEFYLDVSTIDTSQGGAGGAIATTTNAGQGGGKALASSMKIGTHLARHVGDAPTTGQTAMQSQTLDHTPRMPVIQV